MARPTHLRLDAGHPIDRGDQLGRLLSGLGLGGGLGQLQLLPGDVHVDRDALVDPLLVLDAPAVEAVGECLVDLLLGGVLAEQFRSEPQVADPFPLDRLGGLGLAIGLGGLLNGAHRLLRAGQFAGFGRAGERLANDRFRFLLRGFNHVLVVYVIHIQLLAHG